MNEKENPFRLPPMKASMTAVGKVVQPDGSVKNFVINTEKLIDSEKEGEGNGDNLSGSD